MVSIAAAVVQVATQPVSVGAWPAVFAALIALASVSGFEIRIRANSAHFEFTSAAILTAAVVEPFGWVVLCTTVGILISKLLARLAPLKVAFNVGKDTAAAAVAAAVISVFGASTAGSSQVVDTLPRHLLLLPLVAAAYAVVEEALFFLVMPAATCTSIRSRCVGVLSVRL